MSPSPRTTDASGHHFPQVIRLKTLLDERDADLESLRAERKDLIARLSAQASGQVRKVRLLHNAMNCIYYIIYI
jgi:hypothetical protein